MHGCSQDDIGNGGRSGSFQIVAKRPKKREERPAGRCLKHAEKGQIGKEKNAEQIPRTRGLLAVKYPLDSRLVVSLFLFLLYLLKLFSG